MVGRFALLLLLCSPFAAAQFRTTSARAGTMSLLQGVANIDGKPVRMLRGSGPQQQMSNGQRLHVDWGRLELTLGPGAALSMTQGSTLHMQENYLGDIRVELEEGSALVKVDRVYKGWRLRVTVAGGTAELHAGGWYRFDASPRTLRVYRGGAEVALGGSVVKAKKGQAVDLPAGAVSASDLKDADPLIAWALQRNREAEDRQRRFTERNAMQRARREVQSAEHHEMAEDRNRAPLTSAQAAGAQ
jgi:hypothetical protein